MPGVKDTHYTLDPIIIRSRSTGINLFTVVKSFHANISISCKFVNAKNLIKFENHRKPCLLLPTAREGNVVSHSLHREVYLRRGCSSKRNLPMKGGSASKGKSAILRGSTLRRGVYLQRVYLQGVSASMGICSTTPGTDS